MRAILLFLCFIYPCCVLALPEGEEEYRDWESDMLETIEKLSEMRDDGSRRKLATYLRKLSLPFHMESNGRPVFDAARNALVEDSGSIVYFEQELLRLREAQGRGSMDFNRARRWNVFDPLRYLQTPESVDLLIQLLDDDLDFRPAPESPPGISIPDRPGNDFLAEGVLMEMIADLPLNRNRFGGYYRDLPALKRWGAEVRSGDRTFRFVDDPKIYTIDGPVERDGTATSGTEDLNLSRRRPEIPDSLKTDATRSNGFPWLPVGAALLFLLAGFGALLRCSHRRRG